MENYQGEDLDTGAPPPSANAGPTKARSFQPRSRPDATRPSPDAEYFRLVLTILRNGVKEARYSIVTADPHAVVEVLNEMDRLVDEAADRLCPAKAIGTAPAPFSDAVPQLRLAQLPPDAAVWPDPT